MVEKKNRFPQKFHCLENSLTFQTCLHTEWSELAKEIKAIDACWGFTSTERGGPT